MEQNLKIKNWENFYQHHLGDWHGTWNVYTSDGDQVDSFRCIRSFRSASDELVHHRNHYFYANGQEKTETFGPYVKPEMRGTYLNNSFSWGTKEVSDKFAFETGFSCKNNRASLVAIYAQGTLSQIITIVEHLNEFEDFSTFQVPVNLEGKSESISPDLVVSTEKKPTWQPLAEKLTLSFPGNLAFSCPRELTPSPFDLSVDWLALPNTLYRGIRTFDSMKLKKFTLQTFFSSKS